MEMVRDSKWAYKAERPQSRLDMYDGQGYRNSHLPCRSRGNPINPY